MKWIENLEKNNTSFNIHVLQKNDYIIFPNILKTIYLINILDGLLQILQIFTNGENICRQLLSQHSVLINIKYEDMKELNYYYKAVAVKKTVILTIPFRIIKKDIGYHAISFLTTQHFNAYLYNHMLSILCHRNTKRRLIQFFLILSEKFGYVDQNYIIMIPFHLSHQTISKIIGSQRVTITKIMNDLKKNKIIFYDNHHIIIYNLLKLIES